MRNRKTVIIYTKGITEDDPSWTNRLIRKFMSMGYNCIVVPSEYVDTIEVF